MRGQAAEKIAGQVAGGRPRGFDCDEALDIALDLFWRHGYEGVSIAMLTESIGIAPPSLYSAFGNKASLYRAAIARYRQQRMPGPDDLPSSGYEAVKKILLDGVRHTTQRGRPKGCMVSSGLLGGGPDLGDLASEVRALRGESFSQLKQIIEVEKREGRIAATIDAADLARFYVSVLHGLAIQACDGASRAQLQRVVHRALEAWPGEQGIAEQT